MFDPWEASGDDALRAEDEWLAAGDHAASWRSPFAQWVAARRIESMRSEIEAGGPNSGFAVLAAVRDVLAHELTSPEWLVFAYTRRYDAVLNCAAGSWDDPRAFGRPYPKGAHLAALRKARRLRWAVSNAVSDTRARDPAATIGRDLFERVGRDLGIGKTLAERYFYEAEAMLRRPDPPGRHVFRMGRRIPAKSAKFAGRVPRKR